MRHLTLWLRWSWRDLRARWLQVAAIALIVGIGSGTYSGLSSVSEWRHASYDASYDGLEMFDLHVEFAEGAYLDQDEVLAALGGIPSAGDLDEVEPRLVVPTQVDASELSPTGEVVLVQGRIIGVDVTDDGPHVSALHVFEGRGLRADDTGNLVAVLDQHFVDENDLPATGRFTVSGGRTVEYVGTGDSPEYFIVLGEQGDLFAAQHFAVMWAPLDAVQEYAERPGQVNDLVLTVVDGADVAQIEREVSDALTAAFPDTGFEIVRQEDDRGLRLLYDDIDGDQRFYSIFAMLILLGAAFAAFTLTGRVVEAQRREIGIGMALGVQPARIAVRPLLMAAQVALLGVVFGVGVGLLIDEAMASLLSGLFPLPVWEFDFQPSVFLRGAALGLLLPFAATLFPVWRAVRVTPVDAISTTHRSARGGFAPLLRRLPLPGRSTAQMPFRNVLRTPRRTLLTAMGIAAAITTLVGVIGMIDSFLVTVDRGDAEILGDSPNRLAVDLGFFYPEDSPEVQAVTGSDLLASAEPELQIGGWLEPGDDEVPVFLDFIDFESDVWRPTATSGELRTDVPGVVIADKAAEDLGVGVGDTVVLRHPKREGLSYTFVETELPVLAIHPNPYRFLAYVDRRYADLADLEGIVNSVRVVPAPGVGEADVQRALFGLDGVASVQPVRASAESIRDRIEEAVGVFTIIQAAVLLLALLIAFNSTSISMDERAREHATMFAFGLRTRAVMRIAVVESLLIGVLGTVMGVIAGRLLLEWLIRVLIPQTIPEIGIVAELSTETIVTAIVLGVVAVAVAPLLTLRKLRRMDISSTLRVVE